ncbi:MAG: hypothetical protein EU548_04270 [Promethearchaeota archaeon]|nr:MAG: hypothetical protein EU548_04270 [Candidatus Lokiarchaeota archaeon]
MSLENQEPKKPEATESPPLFNYLREEIPLEDLRDYASPQRIESIDAVKGFAIIFIILAHAAGGWFDAQWVYIFGMVFAALDIMGPSLFIFLSALSVIFSIKKKKGKLPDNVIRNRIFSRGATIMLIGIIYNIFSLPNTPFPLNLWGWNILMFIGFSQICSYYALKMSGTTRVILGLFIIFTAPDFRMFLYLEKDANLFYWILHFLITSPAPHVTLVPWVGVIFISTIFGEMLYEAMMDGSKEYYVALCRSFIFWGAFCVLLGILLGSALQTPDTLPVEEYPHLDVLRIMNQQDYYQFPGLPEFLIRGTVGNMFYNLGAALLIIAIFFYLLDIKKKENLFFSMLKYYGKVSLSLFLIHYTFVPIFIGQFSIAVFPFIILAYIGFMGFFMYLWMEYWSGVGSPEWIMIQMGRVGQKTGEKVKEEAKVVGDKLEKGFKKTVDLTKKTVELTKEELKKIKKRAPKKEENAPES